MTPVAEPRDHPDTSSSPLERLLAVRLWTLRAERARIHQGGPGGVSDASPGCISRELRLYQAG